MKRTLSIIFAFTSRRRKYQYDFNYWSISNDWTKITIIEQKANDRIKNSQAFNIIKGNTDWLSKNADSEVALGLDAYKKQQNLL